MNSSYALYATDMPQGFPEVMGGKPWDNVDGLQRENPMFYAKNFKTPTLITHGELDDRVPHGNGHELYGVQQAMNVPTRFDVLVDGCLLLELKCVENVIPIHNAQLLSYMKLLDIPIGLVINFTELKLVDGISRMILSRANQ